MTAEVKLGDVIRDNRDGLAWTIVAIHEKDVTASNGQFAIGAYLRNIHADKKPRKTGFTLLPRETT